MKKKSKGKFASADEVYSALHEKSESAKKLYLLVEFKKVNPRLGIISGELSQSGQKLFTGKMTEYPEPYDGSFNWNRLKSGESYISGFSLESHKDESWLETIKRGVRQAIGDGRIPFLK